MRTFQNDTYGILDQDEHDALRRAARPCVKCGMLANVDPVFHAARYGHRPVYRDEQGTWEYWPRIMTWIRLTSPPPCQSLVLWS